MQLSFEKKRSLLTGRYNTKFSLITELKDDIAPLLFDGLLRQVLPLRIFSSVVLEDLKGRDVSSSRPSLRPGIAEEIFSVKGEVPLHARGDARNIFEISVTSAFKAFQGVHHIEHTVNESRVGVLPEFVKTRNLARVFPLRITSFGFGLEQFTSQQFFFFGFTPEVTQTLNLQYSDETLSLTIEAAKLKTLAELPFSQSGVFEKLDKVFGENLGIDLSKQYLTRCH